MKLPYAGAIDCDLHPAMPSAAALLPYLDDYWRDQLVNRHIDKYSFILTSYPPHSPLSARPDWRQASGLPAGDLEAIRRQALDPFGSRFAICNVLHGALALFNDRRFVQVLLLAMGEMLLGRRLYWPVYAAAEKHGLAVGIHAGSSYHHAPMPSGWPAHRVEDYVAQSTAFESQLLSFLAE